MNTAQLKEKLQGGALAKYGHLYRNIEAQSARYLRVLEAFEEKFGNSDEVYLLSVPGRSELSGNHTDHNFGKVLAGAIDRDIIAVVAKNDEAHNSLAHQIKEHKADRVYLVRLLFCR